MWEFLPQDCINETTVLHTLKRRTYYAMKIFEFFLNNDTTCAFVYSVGFVMKMNTECAKFTKNNIEQGIENSMIVKTQL